MKLIYANGVTTEVYNTTNPNDLEIVTETCLSYYQQEVRNNDPCDNVVADYTREIASWVEADTKLDKWNKIIHSNLFHDAVGELVDFEGRNPYEIWVAIEY